MYHISLLCAHFLLRRYLFVSEVVFPFLHRVQTAGSAPVAINGTTSPANVQGAPQASFPELPVPQRPQVTLAAPAHVVAAEEC